MKGIVADVKGGYMVVLSGDGRFVKMRNNRSCKVGCEIDLEKPAGINTRMLARVSSVAAGAALALGLGYCAYSYTVPYGYVDVDINPSIELTTNVFDRILKAEGLNEDGRKLLQEDSLKNSTLGRGIAIVLDKAVKQGYLKEESTENAVVFTVVTGDDGKSAKLEQGLEAAANTELEAVSIQSALVVTKASREEHASAREKGLTPGKLSLIEKAIGTAPELKIEDLKDAPVKDIIKQIRQNRPKDAQEEYRNRGDGKQNADEPRQGAERGNKQSLKDSIQNIMNSLQNRLQSIRNSIQSGKGGVQSTIDSVQGGENSLRNGKDNVQGGNSVQNGKDSVQGGNSSAQGRRNSLQGGNSVQNGKNSVPGGNSSAQNGKNSVPGGKNSAQSGKNSIQDGNNSVQNEKNSVPGGNNSGQSGRNSIQGGKDSGQSEKNSVQNGKKSVQDRQGIGRDDIQIKIIGKDSAAGNTGAADKNGRNGKNTEEKGVPGVNSDKYIKNGDNGQKREGADDGKMQAPGKSDSAGKGEGPEAKGSGKSGGQRDSKKDGQGKRN